MTAAQSSQRGWWWRWSAADVSPWDGDDELTRLKVEMPAVRKQNTRKRRERRRVQRRSSGSAS